MNNNNAELDKCDSRFFNNGVIYRCALLAGHENAHDYYAGCQKLPEKVTAKGKQITTEITKLAETS